ncbi:MAG: phage terminase large subunit family protein [Chloroflexi bacterium]|nr:phage terminase large subunit family protein [Chloroflexota bacterium]
MALVPGVGVETPLDELGLRDHLRESARAMRSEAVPATAPEIGERRELNFMEWSLLTPTGQGDRLDFDRFPYLRELYSEEVAQAREVVLQKGTQIGASEVQWRWGARRADQFGDTVIYVFPTAEHVRDFSDERIEPAIQASEYLSSRIGAHYVRNKSLKRIGAGWVHFRGSRSSVGATNSGGGKGPKRAVAAQSVAAQAIVFDEYDDLEPRQVSQYERRITAAQQIGKAPRIRRFGVPTIPGRGIAAAFERSDKRRWNVTCAECGHQQVPSWRGVRWTMPGEDHVYRSGDDAFDDPDEVGEVWRACVECEEKLNVADGEWIADQPGRQTIGFHVNRLIVPNADLRQLVRASRLTKPHEAEAFVNNDLGEPYAPAEAALDEQTILAACALGLPPERITQGSNTDTPKTMGIDVAGERDLNVRISEHLPGGVRQALWIGTVADFQEAARMIQNFGVWVAVVDSNPERRFAKTLRSSFEPGRVILCEYDDRNESESIKIGTGDVGTAAEGAPVKVRVNMVEAMDATMDAIRQQRNRPWQQPPRGYVDHLQALKRRTIEDARGRPKRVYESTGADDYFHCEVYDMVASDLLSAKIAIHEQSQLAPTPVPDERLGFTRPALDRGLDEYAPGLSDDYDPGFGGDGPRF